MQIQRVAHHKQVVTVAHMSEVRIEMWESSTRKYNTIRSARKPADVCILLARLHRPESVKTNDQEEKRGDLEKRRLRNGRSQKRIANSNWGGNAARKRRSQLDTVAH